MRIPASDKALLLTEEWNGIGGPLKQKGHAFRVFPITNQDIQGDLIGCRTGNGEKLSSSHAEPVQAIKSAGA